MNKNSSKQPQIIFFAALTNPGQCSNYIAIIFSTDKIIIKLETEINNLWNSETKLSCKKIGLVGPVALK